MRWGSFWLCVSAMLVADMIQSDELFVTYFFPLLLTNYSHSSKYSLAVIDILLDVFGSD